MKIIIAGSRSFNDYEYFKACIATFNKYRTITEVVSGGAKGADALGERYADENGIPVKKFEADWSAYGKRAGPIRNRAMAEYADGAICFWGMKSRGTENMINNMKLERKFLQVYKIV